MKTIVSKETGVSLFLVEDSTSIELYDTHVVCGDENILDLNKENAVVFENVTHPDGWLGGLFTYIDGIWTNITPEVEAQRREIAARGVRAERNRRLAECDWTQLNDSPLDSHKKLLWAQYREELRAVPQQAGFPYIVDWPSPP